METKKKIFIWLAVVVAIIVALVVIDQVNFYLNSAARVTKKYEKRMEKINKDYEDARKAIETLKKYED